MGLGATLYVVYGDVLAEKLPGVNLLIAAEALREGPLSPDPTEYIEEFVARRARYLAMRYGATESPLRAELEQAWRRLAAYPRPIVLHVDAAPCIDGATFVECSLGVIEQGGRYERTHALVARARGVGATVPLTPHELPEGAAAWRTLCAEDRHGLERAAARPGNLSGRPEFSNLH